MNKWQGGSLFWPAILFLKHNPNTHSPPNLIKPLQSDRFRDISTKQVITQPFLRTLHINHYSATITADPHRLTVMSEVNRLTWDDVYFKTRTVTLYTRKKKGGSLTPRKVPMTKRLFEILSHRFEERDTDKPWVFWHTYTSSKTREKKEGPYRERKRIMKTLCKKAGVRYFRFHAMRHSGASLMDNSNVPIGAIQSILGHENRATTEIYLHTIGNLERDAMKAFETASVSPSQIPSQSPSQTQQGPTPLS